MPLPVLHSYAGYSLYKFSPESRLSSFTLILFSVFAANAPDFDFIPGILIGKAGHFHHGISHSLGAALIFGLICALVFKAARKLRFWNAFRFSSLTYASHIILDAVTHPADTMPVFWPFFNKPVSHAAHSFIPAFQHAPETAKTGAAEFLRILSGPTTCSRVMSEIIFVAAMTMIFGIYGELKKYASQSRREKENSLPVFSAGRLPASINLFQNRTGNIAAFSGSEPENVSGSSYFSSPK